MRHKWDDLIDEGKRLIGATAGCREDMHEPDNNGVSLVAVLGTQLDNAMGLKLELSALEDLSQEAVVILKQETADDTFTHRFNLATLIALARFGTKFLVTEKSLEEAFPVDKTETKE